MRICVYCASSSHVGVHYVEAAAELGRRIGERGDELIYGGTNTGLMGTLSGAAQAAGARVTGVVPRQMADHGLADDEHTDELIVTDGMSARKVAMQDRADAFVALPGGFGTLEELMEVLTLKQLGYHDRPIVMVNIDGFWDHQLEVFDAMYRGGFARREYARLYHVAPTVVGVFAHLDVYSQPNVPSKRY